MPKASLIWSRYCPACDTDHETRVLVTLDHSSGLPAARENFQACCEEWFEHHVDGMDQYPPGATTASARADAA